MDAVNRTVYEAVAQRLGVTVEAWLERLAQNEMNRLKVEAPQTYAAAMTAVGEAVFQGKLTLQTGEAPPPAAEEKAPPAKRANVKACARCGQEKGYRAFASGDGTCKLCREKEEAPPSAKPPAEPVEDPAEADETEHGEGPVREGSDMNPGMRTCVECKQLRPNASFRAGSVWCWSCIDGGRQPSAQIGDGDVPMSPESKARRERILGRKRLEAEKALT